MLLKEYRIPFPSTLAEYKIARNHGNGPGTLQFEKGMLYMTERATREENVRRQGSQFVTEVKRERYYDHERGLHGIYTEKVCNIRSILPTFIKVFIPASSSVLIEKAWNAFPEHCLAVYESPFLGSSFHLSIESRYVERDKGEQNNALGLKKDELDQRGIVNLNIASEDHLRMTKETNVLEFQSKKSRRPALDAEGIWVREGDPIMCCYKVCRLHVSKPGLPGSQIEKWGHKHGLQTAFLRFHRQQFCWIDSWLGLRMADVDGLNDGVDDTSPRKITGIRPKLESAATMLATEISAESSAGLAFSFSDETNPFFA